MSGYGDDAQQQRAFADWIRRQRRLSEARSRPARGVMAATDPSAGAPALRSARERGAA